MSRPWPGDRGGSDARRPNRLNHGVMPFDVDEELELHAQSMRRDYGLFPPLVVPKPIQQDRRVRQQIEDYRDMQLRRRHGPYFRAGANIAARGGIVKERKSKSVFNAFEDNSSYLKERAAKARDFMEAEFSKLLWSKEMFPKELWETIGSGKGSRYRPKTGRVYSNGTMKSRLDKISDEEQEQQPEQAEPKEKHPAADAYKGEFDVRDDGYDDADRDKEEKDVDADDSDNDFEDGDDDMAGDYNAEQYFENGDEDRDDLDDEGGRDNEE